MVLLFGEIYGAIRTRRLEPAVRTQYVRLAWQSDDSARVPVSLDTQLSMLFDPLAPLLPDEVTWATTSPSAAAVTGISPA